MIKYGDTMNTTCSAYGKPKVEITWKFQSIQNDTFETLASTPFPIVNFSKHNEGLYTCVLSNGIGNAVKRLIKTRIIANSAPNIFKADAKTVYVNIGDDLLLNCRCDMCEPLIGFWIHVNNQNTISSKVGNLKINDWLNRVDFSLHLINISNDDSGLYTCHLKNDFGHSHYTLEVIVNEHLPFQHNSHVNNGNVSTSNAIQLMNDIIYSKCLRKNVSTATNHELFDVYDCNAFNANSEIKQNFTIMLLCK